MDRDVAGNPVDENDSQNDAYPRGGDEQPGPCRPVYLWTCTATAWYARNGSESTIRGFILSAPLMFP